MYFTNGDRISLKAYRFVGEDEGGQLSSSLAMIYIVGATKALLDLLLKSPHTPNKGLVVEEEKWRGE